MKIFIRYLLIISTSVWGRALAGYDDIEIIHSSTANLHFVYHVPKTDFIDLKKNNEVFTDISIPFCISNEETGHPKIAKRIIRVAIPGEGQYHITVHAGKHEIFNKVNLIPLPRIIPQKMGYTENYEKGAGYSLNAYTPSSFYKIEAPHTLRNHQVITLVIYPLQYNPVQQKVKLYKDISVRVTFSALSLNDQSAPKYDNYFEGIYRDLLLNYEDAKTWRARKKREFRRFKSSITHVPDIWYKIKVRNEGIYKVTYSDLQDANISVSSGAQIQLYTGSGKELDTGIEATTVFPQDTLAKVPLYVSSSSSFGTNDYFLFYGYGLSGWEYDKAVNEFSYYHNHFSDDNIYWLKIDNSAQKQMPQFNEDTGQNPVILTEFQKHLHGEENFVNPNKSGLEWYWATLPFSREIAGVTQINTSKGASLKISMKSSSSTQVKINNISVGTISLSAEVLNITAGILQGSSVPQLSLELSSGSNHLDWYEFTYWKYLKADNNELHFSSDTTGSIKYSLSNFSPDGPVWIFDVTGRSALSFLKKSLAGGKISFQIAQSGKKIFYVCMESAFKRINGINKDNNSTLASTTQSADYLIITPAEFQSEVTKLAEFRKKHNNFEVKVALLSDIYDEFATGRFDITAIRDFIAYTAHWQKEPEFVLFVGDGHYDFKNYTNSGKTNWMPPYQGSDAIFSSFPGYATYITSDDFYLKSGSTNNNISKLNGRLAINSKEELAGVIDKIISYESNTKFENGWNNRVILVGDDEYANGNDNEISHIQQAEALAGLVPRQMNITKIYLTEYEFDLFRNKPEANDAFLRAFNQGALMMNYVGHGSPDVIAHERVFRFSEDKLRIENGARLPVFIAATCAAGSFDDLSVQSMAEGLVAIPGGGAIAAIAGTRLTFGYQNALFNQSILKTLFNTSPVLGYAIIKAKAERNYSSNSSVYTLFGDPALALKIPQPKVKITSMSPDTLKALSTVTVQGRVEENGSLWASYNGTVFLSAFDAEKIRNYKNEASDASVTYTLPGGTLYRGKTDVTDGVFSFRFIVPKDISYNKAGGRISALVYSGQGFGAGSLDSIFIGGTATTVSEDIQGPDITLTLKRIAPDKYDAVNKSPTIVVTLEDKSGINLTGSIGHGLILTLDDNPEFSNDVTSNFVYEKNSYTKGSVEYTLFNLTEGWHKLTLKAWDNMNNSSKEALQFKVVSDRDLIVSDPLNYPNPFKSTTTIGYTLSKDAEKVAIKIYTVSGKLIRVLNDTENLFGYNHTDWDGRDSFGNRLANGTYLYVVSAKPFKEGIGKEKPNSKTTGFAVIMR